MYSVNSRLVFSRQIQSRLHLSEPLSTALLIFHCILTSSKRTALRQPYIQRISHCWVFYLGVEQTKLVTFRLSMISSRRATNRAESTRSLVAKVTARRLPILLPQLSQACNPVPAEVSQEDSISQGVYRDIVSITNQLTYPTPPPLNAKGLPSESRIRQTHPEDVLTLAQSVERRSYMRA